jgi:hypothetical protein
LLDEPFVPNSLANVLVYPLLELAAEGYVDVDCWLVFLVFNAENLVGHVSSRDGAR